MTQAPQHCKGGRSRKDRRCLHLWCGSSWTYHSHSDEFICQFPTNLVIKWHSTKPPLRTREGSRACWAEDSHNCLAQSPSFPGIHQGLTLGFRITSSEITSDSEEKTPLGNVNSPLRWYPQSSQIQRCRKLSGHCRVCEEGLRSWCSMGIEF